MMINRERVSFWARFIAIFLAVVFIGSFIFFGIGSNVSYNLVDLLGGGDQQQQQQQQQGGGIQDQVERAEKRLEENPRDPEAIKSLAGLYYQAGRMDDAARVLENGREKVPKDAEVANLLGQVYLQQAQQAPKKEQDKLYGKAGDAFAAAADLNPKDEQAFYYAGAAYDQAGQPGQAIKYWNGYLELEPKGDQAKAVKDRISALLKGEEADGGAQP